VGNAPTNAPIIPNPVTSKSNQDIALCNFGMHVVEEFLPLMKHLRQLDVAKERDALLAADIKWPYNENMKSSNMIYANSNNPKISSVDMTIAISYYDDMDNEVVTYTSLDEHLHRIKGRGDYISTLSVSSKEVEPGIHSCYVFRGYGSIYIQVKKNSISMFDLRFSHDRIIYPLVIIKTSLCTDSFQVIEGNCHKDVLIAHDAYKEYEPFVRQVVDIFKLNYLPNTMQINDLHASRGEDYPEESYELLTIG